VSLFGKNRDDRESMGKRPAAPDPWGTPAPIAPEAPAEPRPRVEKPARASAGGEMANIGKSISIKGDLSGNEDLVVEGSVEGRIELPNNQLTIGANGNVKADVSAKSVVVVGKVAGNVTGVERVQIEATGSVQGDVRTPRLVVQEGATLNGSVEMGPARSVAQGPTLARPVAVGEG
jgi:cytoskeletal protein CcmA (bactofilin family)